MDETWLVEYKDTIMLQRHFNYEESKGNLARLWIPLCSQLPFDKVLVGADA